METLIGVIIGICLCVFSLAGFYLVRDRKRAKRIPPPTNYDPRIDEVAKSGLVRYKLHKAMTDPTRRDAIRNTPLWEAASSILGWDGED